MMLSDIPRVLEMRKAGMTYREIAEEYQTTPQTVKSLIQEGKKPKEKKPRTGEHGPVAAARRRALDPKEIAEESVRISEGIEKHSHAVMPFLKPENAGKATKVNSHVLQCIMQGQTIDQKNINSLWAGWENYIKLCVQNDMPLTMNAACLSLGLDPALLQQWRTGTNAVTNPDFMAFAKAVTFAVHTGIEICMSQGIINPVVGIWWEKAHFHMIEAQNVEAPDKDPLGEKKSPEAIAAEYEQLELPE
jgi:predicted transcriptional regulator